MTKPAAQDRRQTLLAQADDLFDQASYTEALTLYQEADRLRGDDVEALTGMALCSARLDRHHDAVIYLTRVRQWLPDSTELLYLLGDALLKERRRQEARDCFLDLLAKEPERAAVHFQLGKMAMEDKQPAEAFQYFQAALERDPEYIDAYGLLGVLLSKHCRYTEAEQVLKKACELNPEYILAINNLGSLYKMQGRLAESRECYRAAMAIEPHNPTVTSNYLFGLNNEPALTPEMVAAEHLRLAGIFAAEHPVSLPATARAGSRHDRIRVGYISGDLYAHSVSYFIEPILQHHDRQRFEIFCYSSCGSPDETTQRIKELPLVWRDIVGMSDEGVARLISEDGIDVLIELAGHTADNSLRVCAMRPAPIQASWIGYPATTGLSQMDYYITDAICDPPGRTEHLYSEKLCRLPEVFSCYLPPMNFPAVGPPPHESSGMITFCCFNSFAKVSEEMMGLWATILKRVPHSRLYLKSMPLGDVETRERLFTLFESHGIARERLFMRTVAMTPLEHLAEYSNADIALDTFPYNGTTTSCEALWMGVPMVSLAGASHVSRVGMSFLTAIGLESLVADSPEAYVDIAVSLATDRHRLSSLRTNLRGMMARSPLMDGARLTRHLEAALHGMLA